jgi:hypothetical protein
VIAQDVAQAAKDKTEGPIGDAATINDFKELVREMVQVFATGAAGRASARSEMAGATLRLLTAFAGEAKSRTNDAIARENQTNGAARGPEGSPEPPRPSANAVNSAYNAQKQDINNQLSERIKAFLAARTGGEP